MVHRIAIPALMLAVLCGSPDAAPAETLFGEPARLGDATARSYAVVGADGRLTAVGVSFKADALEGLPEEPNMTSRCFDLDKNGRINDHGECEGDYELRLALPAGVDGKADVPFRWIGVNWNPHGHPPLPWSVPHFDFHFYTVGQAAVDAIRVGPCDFFIDCGDREIALKPVDPELVHPNHINVGATVSKMGNHLIDSKTPELGENDPPPFTHTWIFGAYDGKITFYEPMITLAYLQELPNGCTPIKQPKAWEQGGYYPTLYCTRYSKDHANYTVSLEGMTLRRAR
jgi:hypothetical protein